jgi:hypothetical protein
VTVESWVGAEEKARIFESAKTDPLLELGAVFADRKYGLFRWQVSNFQVEAVYTTRSWRLAFSPGRGVV